MSNLTTTYTKILSLLHEIEPDDYYLNQIRIPQLTDKQLIALNLAAECLGIDSERYLFKRIPTELVGKIERTVYNRRKRNLAFKVEQFRQAIASKVALADTHHIVDSMPLEICKYSRSRRNKFSRSIPDIAPSYGYCAAQQTHYFGYKFHAVCTSTGVFQAFDITKASVHDIHYLNDIKYQFNECVLIGDKGYLSREYQADLFETSAIRLETPSRKNQINRKPFHRSLRRARKRIETLYSQLCDQFMIRRNYAKTFQGLSIRVLSKITALTVLQWINKLNGNNINNLKFVPA